MDLQTVKTEQNCPRDEIAFYLDGELSPHEEIVLEKHLTVCKTCLTELNLQKKMLSALDFAFDKRQEIELPKNFTKVVVAKAESGVRGLRSKKERFWALFLGSVLFLLLLLGLGTETEKVFSTFNSFSNQAIAIAGFVVHLLYQITIGIVVVLRCLSQKAVVSSGFILLSVGCVLSIFLLTFSRFVERLSRPKTS